MAIDQTKLQALLGRAVVDIGANFHAALVVTGDKLGLFRALREARADDPRGPGEANGPRAVHPRMALRDGRGRVHHQFSLSEEQALALIVPTCPVPS